jgi:D-alanyl-lipoteichoic acid acyltransferase DltB (MBOAT superfamily)
MGFLSLKFILILPIVLILYFAAGKREKYDLSKVVLIASSMLFFLSYGTESFLLLLASCIFNLFLSKLLLKKKNKALLATGIVINVLPLLAFKYLNFFAETFHRLAGGEFTAIDIIAPVAISYYTFQMITWTVDSYRGETASVKVSMCGSFRG